MWSDKVFCFGHSDPYERLFGLFLTAFLKQLYKNPASVTMFMVMRTPPAFRKAEVRQLSGVRAVLRGGGCKSRFSWGMG